MLFVLGGHLAIVGIRLRRRSVSLDGPALGIGLAAALGLALYAPILSRVLVVSQTEGRRGDIAEWTSARWALGEVAQTLSASFVAAPVAAAAVALGLIGIARLARSRSELLWLLFVPTGIGATGRDRVRSPSVAAALLLRDRVRRPRRCGGISALADFVEHRSAGWLTRATVFRALAALLVVAAATSLPRAFGPKQRFRDPMALVDGARRPGDVVLVTGSAELVYQKHYGKDWRSVRTRDELEAARAGAERTWLVQHLPIQLHARWPDVERALAAEFELAGHFVGTLRGGDVLVWRSSRDGGRGVAAAAPLSSAAGFE
jgi:hypothetical protein